MVTLATMIHKVKQSFHKNDQLRIEEQALDRAIKKYRHLFYE